MSLVSTVRATRRTPPISSLASLQSTKWRPANQQNGVQRINTLALWLVWPSMTAARSVVFVEAGEVDEFDVGARRGGADEVVAETVE